MTRGEKISLALTGKPRNLTEEQKAKKNKHISEALKGRVRGGYTKGKRFREAYHYDGVLNFKEMGSELWKEYLRFS